MKALNSKLKLNKKTIATLDNSEMKALRGGERFTYSLSLGQVCHSEKHPTDCGTVTGTCACCDSAEREADWTVAPR